MSDPATPAPTPAPGGAPKFDPTAEHMVRPKLRRVRGFPMPVQNQQGQRGVMLGIADAQQISPKVVVTQPAVQMILPRMDGTKALDQIVSEVGRGLTTEFMQQ